MSTLWRIVLVVPASASAFLERALEPFADAALSVLDADPASGRRPGTAQPPTWQRDLWLAESCVIEGLATERPDEARLRADIAVAAAAAGIAAPSARIEVVESRDWVAETYRSFPEIAIGRYRIRGSHVAEPARAGTLALTIEAAVAFGTGEHATTHACLLALERLRRRIRPARVLDVGCGSGILALAVARTWACDVLACDIDERAVATTAMNSRINGLSARVTAVVADGYRAAAIRNRAPFELIFSNILARPLIRLAPALSRNLAPGGTAVLSGFLAWQEPAVLSAHRAQGLRLLFRIVEGDWTTIVVGS